MFAEYAKRFDAQSLRERSLIAITALVAVTFVWWTYYAEPRMIQIKAKQQENRVIGNEVDSTRAIVANIRKRMAAGVGTDKKNQLGKLRQELQVVEERLRLKTVELIDPENMFALMNELVYRDSNLKLLNLRRREVTPALAGASSGNGGANATDEPGIFRHVLEIEFNGKYPDIVKYMQSMETLDWKLLWDEIEMVTEEYPSVRVKIVMSTLSTRREWVGI